MLTSTDSREANDKLAQSDKEILALRATATLTAENAMTVLVLVDDATHEAVRDLANLAGSRQFAARRQGRLGSCVQRQRVP